MLNEIILLTTGILLALIDSIDILILVILLNILNSKNTAQNYLSFSLTYIFWGLVQGTIILILGNKILTSTALQDTQTPISINAIIGTAIILYAIYSWFKTEKPVDQNKYKKSSVVQYAITATAISIIGIPESFLYYGYLLEVASQNQPLAMEITALIIYNLAFFVPYTILYKAHQKYGAETKAKAENILTFISDKKIAEILLILIGVSILLI